MDGYQRPQRDGGSRPDGRRSEKMSLHYVTNRTDCAPNHNQHRLPPAPVQAIEAHERASGTSQHPRRPVILVQQQSAPCARPTDQHGAAVKEARTPRDGRPPYTEIEKLWIMYARIIRGGTWNETEADFQACFGPRTRGGLACEYYRIRESWKLGKVTENDRQILQRDRKVLRERIKCFYGPDLEELGIDPSDVVDG